MPQQQSGTLVHFERSRWLSAQAIFLLAFGLAFSPMGPAIAGTVKHIATFEDLAQAVRRAQPGDVLTLAPGTYEFRHKIKLDRPGKKNAPIILRAAKLGEVRIKSGGVVAFNVSAPYWIVENLDVEGVCKEDSSCEHAFHIFGDAQGVIIRGNRLHEYNAMIKMNGVNDRSVKKGQKPQRIYPNDVLIENNIFFGAVLDNAD